MDNNQTEHVPPPEIKVVLKITSTITPEVLEKPIKIPNSNVINPENSTDKDLT